MEVLALILWGATLVIFIYAMSGGKIHHSKH
jgi:hypothetical protein